MDGLFLKAADGVSISRSKVTIVGVGQVGMACAYSILNQVCILFYWIYLLERVHTKNAWNVYGLLIEAMRLKCSFSVATEFG